MLCSTLAGTFRRDPESTADEGAWTWRCPICSTFNDETTGDHLSTSCNTCKRSRNPLWLRLEDSGIQIALGSRVFHSSAGGSKSLSVVVVVNYAQKVVTLLRIKAKRNEGQQDDLSFHEVVLNASQLQQQLEPLYAEKEEDCVIDNYGICGECRGVFRVAQGDLQSQYANEDRIKTLQRELEELIELKKRLAREKAFEWVLACSEKGKFLAKQLQVAKRELEFLNPVLCPFCGWASPQPARKNI